MKVKWVRRGIAAVSLVAYFALFLFDVPDLRHMVLTWQPTPALLTLGVATLVLVVLSAVTLIWGKVFCSVLCPAGLLQEAFFRIGRIAGSAKTRFVPAGKPLWILSGAAALLFMGLAGIVNFVDPLGWFGRVAAPIGETVASWRAGTENYRGYLGFAGLGFALGVLALAVVPLWKGRWFCDRLCPVGAGLGALSRLAARRIRVDASACASCRRCAALCPTRCLDPEKKTADPSRCVLCFECLDACPTTAISYAPAAVPGRREAMAAGGALAATAAFTVARSFRGNAVGADAVLPPGFGNASRYFRACIGCQSCAAACPVGIIKPSPYGMQPELRFDVGYCQYNCVRCTRACPTGALRPLAGDEKKTLRVACTEFLLERCIVMTEGTACGACAEVCPTRALAMEEWRDGEPTRPVFYADHCIGCGACLHVCPAAPRAFVVRGLSREERALPMREAPMVETPAPESDDDALFDFPF